jgi:hypothetical protein
VAALQVTSSAPAGTGQKGPVDGRHFGPRNGVPWRGLREAVLGVVGCGPRESGGRSCGATGSARYETARFSRRETIPTLELTPLEKTGVASQEVRAASMATDAAAPNRCVTRDRRCPRAIRCLLGRHCVQTQYERAGGRPVSEEGVSEVRASCARVGGFQGCSLTTSWLQRLVRGILSQLGAGARRKSSHRGTGEMSSSRRPITVTGGGPRRAARVSQRVDRVLHDFDPFATPHPTMGIEPVEGILS